MARRLYLGSAFFPLHDSNLLLNERFPHTELPPDTRTDDVSKFFDGYGKIVDCRVMTGE